MIRLLSLRRLAVAAAVVATSLSLPMHMDAQVGPNARRGGPDRDALEQRIRARMGQVIQERLGLEDDQAAALEEVVNTFDERRRDLARQQQATRRRVEALLIEDAGDDAAAAELVARVAELRIAEAELFREEQRRLLEVLSPTQVLELSQLRAQIGERIRAIRGRGGEGPGRGGRPNRPGGRRGPGG